MNYSEEHEKFKIREDKIWEDLRKENELMSQHYYDAKNAAYKREMKKSMKNHEEFREKTKKGGA